MIERGSTTGNDMVAAFLRVEIDSSRYADYIKMGLAQLGLGRRLIDEPNLADEAENATRKQLLTFRGYDERTALFAGFPGDAIWRRVALEARDFKKLQYANHKTWLDLSDGTRLISVGARNLNQRPDDKDTSHINAIAKALRNGARFPELIAAQHHDGYLVLIEGHSRATAYVMERFGGDVEVLVASSPFMPGWAFY